MALATDQLLFLQHKLAEATGSQPQWTLLRTRLLALGGDEVVAVYDEDLTRLLTYGDRRRAVSVLSRPGRPCGCHGNAAALWEQNPEHTTLVTGYALSADGLWRQHSWCERTARIIETTTPRSCYYGFALTADEAAVFAAANL